MSGTVGVVGLHGGESFGPAAAAALALASVVVGSPRHLDATAGRWPAGAKVVRLEGPIDAVIDRVAAESDGGASVVVLASGDPGWFGIVRALGRRLGPDRLAVHPAPSSVALAFGRLGLAWDAADVVSAHGRPLAAAVSAVRASAAPEVALLTSPDSPPQAVAAALVAAGEDPLTPAAVATHLGDPARESLTTSTLAAVATGRHDPMSVLVLHGRTAAPGQGWGLPEAAFEHRDGMITKPEVRAVVLGKLALPPTGVVWDVGAGSGSVAVECARLAPGLRVVAVERDPDQAGRVRANATAHGVTVEVVEGVAPAVLAGLPDPDRIFVGGGGPGVVDAALARLGPGGTLVATFAVVDSALAAAARLGSMVQVSVSRAVPTGSAGMRLRADNPVFVCWGPA